MRVNNKGRKIRGIVFISSIVFFLGFVMVYRISGTNSEKENQITKSQDAEKTVYETSNEVSSQGKQAATNVEKVVTVQERLAEEKKKLEEEQKQKEEQERIAKEEAAKKIAEEAKKKEEKVKSNSSEALQTGVIENNPNLSVEERIRGYLGSSINNFGIIYYDLTTGEKIAINENKVFTAASTYKVGLNIVAYEAVKNGTLSLNTRVQYNYASDYEGGTGILQGQTKTTLASPVELQKLLDLCITHSDNIATRMASRVLGGTSAVRVRMNEIAGLSCEVTNNKTTPEIQFRLLKLVYENRNDTYYSHLIEIMKNTIFHDRLDKYIPQSIVAHKIGDYAAAVNDIGIVFTDKPYIIVVYSENAGGAYEKIAQLSQMIYEEQLKK